MKIFVLNGFRMDEWYPIGVYSTQEAACAAAQVAKSDPSAHYNADFEVAEMELDAPTQDHWPAIGKEIP